MPEKAPQDTESRHADKYIVRFPEGMRDKLKAEAASNNRTLNAEIVLRLQESLSGSGQAARPFSTDLSALLAKMEADQKKTSLRMALMHAENVSTAARGLAVEIRQLKEVIAAAERMGSPSPDVETLRHELRLAEQVLPQQYEIVRAARQEAEELQQQIAAIDTTTAGKK